MEEGTATLIRLVAPIKNAYDAVASMMLMPIIKVNLTYGDGKIYTKLQLNSLSIIKGSFF